MKRLSEAMRGEGVSHIRPFFWMKGEDNATIRDELDRVEACGIREVCLESRPHPDFCGPGWWENLDFLLAEAERRGMRVWILDDDKFPTGHANGGFARQPEKSKLYLGERHMDVFGPCEGGSVLVENFLPPDGRLLAILAVAKPDGETLAVDGTRVLNLTDTFLPHRDPLFGGGKHTLHDGFVTFDVPPGPYRLFILFTTRTGGGREQYMNLIDEESVRVLLDEVYEKHWERYRRYFGTTLAGFFSDEPELGNVKGYPFDCALGQRDIRLPWSAALEARLRDLWGEDFLRFLPALWYESGAHTQRVRTGYMDEMTRLVQHCFTEQVGNWCAAHGVEYIGHIIEDDNAHTRLGCSIGHYFREMAGQHMAGIDVVHHQIVPGFTEPVHQWIAGDRDGEFFHFGLAKLASSAAHVQKNKEGRALCEIFGNYGWAEGNSLMKWLTDHMLVRGVNEFTPHAFSLRYPDRDCPPHFYARGNNPAFPCFAVLMQYMNRAAHLLSGGVPLADAAVLYHAGAEWSGRSFQYFQKPGRALMEHGLDYDVVPADAFEEARCEDGRLVLGQERYPCLVLPGSACVDRRVVSFVLSCNVPVFVTGEIPTRDLNGEPLPDAFQSRVRAVALSELASAVAALCEPDGFAIHTDSRFLRRFATAHEDGLAVMLMNESVTERASFSVSPGAYGSGAAVFYDPWTNRAEPFALAPGETLTLDPGGVLFLCFSPDTKAEEPVPRRTRTEALGCGFAVSLAPVLSEDFTPAFTVGADEKLPNLNGADRFPGFAGTARYEAVFSVAEKGGQRCLLCLPRASDAARVWLNGVDCGYLAHFPGRVDVSAAVREGKNTLRIDVTNTLVWTRKDGASTHLLIPPTGLTARPALEWYDSL